MTLTYAGIARARLVIFTVAGEAKRPALEAVLAGEDLPAARVRAGRVLWLVDRAAAPGPATPAPAGDTDRQGPAASRRPAVARAAGHRAPGTPNWTRGSSPFSTS